jgi:hypothetical protein
MKKYVVNGNISVFLFVKAQTLTSGEAMSTVMLVLA